jgi:hypothetical protein
MTERRFGSNSGRLRRSRRSLPPALIGIPPLGIPRPGDCIRFIVVEFVSLCCPARWRRVPFQMVSALARSASRSCCRRGTAFRRRRRPRTPWTGSQQMARLPTPARVRARLRPVARSGRFGISVRHARESVGGESGSSYELRNVHWTNQPFGLVRQEIPPSNHPV